MGLMSPIWKRRRRGGEFNPASIVDANGSSLLQQFLFSKTALSGSTVFDESSNRGTARPIQLGRDYLGDGINDHVVCGNIGTITKFEGWVRFVTDDQELMTFQNTTATALSVAAGVLTAGASIALGTIAVDGVTKTASEAGVLLNDNTMHYLEINFSAIAASNLRLMTTNSTACGNIETVGWKFLNVTTTQAFYKCDEQAGIIAYDSSGNGYHGTITNATLATFHSTQNTISYQNNVGYSLNRNFFKYSEDVSAANWTKNGGSITNGSKSDPLGGTAADEFSEDATTGNHRFFQGTSWTAGQIYTVSAYLKYTGRQFVAVSASDPSATSTILCNLINGTIVGGSGTTPLASGVENVGNGWYRFWVRKVAVGTGTSSNIIYGSSTGTDAGTLSYTGLNAPAFDVFGLQTEIGSLSAYQKNIADDIGVYRPRNEAIPTQDVTGATLQFTGRVPYNALLKQSNCISYDGVNDYITRASAAAISFGAADFSISCRAKINIADITTSMTLMSKWAAGSFEFTMSLNTAERLEVFTSDNTSFPSITSSAAIAVTDWHTYTFTKTGTTGTLYVDGVAVGTGTTIATLPAAGSAFFAGCQNATNNFVNGLQADIRMYNGLLTAADVLDLHTNSTVNFAGKSLVMWYAGSSGAGTIAYDLSPSALNATLANGATYSKQDVFHANFIYGYSRYDHATSADILVPYSSAGVPLVITPPAGYTKISDNPAGIYHNGAETLIDFTGGVASPRAVINSWETAWAFNTARVNPEFKRTITLDALDYRADRFLAYSTALSGNDLTKVQAYTATRAL